ncbi:MAG: hypothetical protein HY751_03835 [Nitrospinae bacterium]|nr:hypothetical protein [Nitrospinota bacterium]
MTFVKWFKAFKTLVLPMTILWIGACASLTDDFSGKHGVTAPAHSASEGSEKIRTVAVLDFIEEKTAKPSNEPAICRITGLAFAPGTVEDGSGEVVADNFRGALGKLGYAALTREETLEALKKFPAPGDDNFVAVAAEVGKALGVEAVVVGSVMRYEDRVGGKYIADKPASVAFSVAVINPADGKITWKAKFDKTQQSLFSDLTDYKTFFKGGMVWQTASQLASLGVENILSQSPFHPVTEKGR